MSQVNLQGPGVDRLPEALDSPGVPKEMRVNPFRDPGLLGDFLDDLPSALAIDPEDPVIQPQFLVEGMALEVMGQTWRAGH